jgi:hypothetical protein
VKKYLACLDQVPEPARAMARQGFDQSREGWKRLAASKVGMQAYGCKW